MSEKFTKVCTGCHRDLPIKEFRKQAKNKDGLQYQCKMCHSSLNEKRYNLKKDEIIAQNVEWQAKNIDKKREFCRKYANSIVGKVKSRFNDAFKRLFGDFRESFFHLTATTAEALVKTIEKEFIDHQLNNYGKTWVFQFVNKDFDLKTEEGRRGLCNWTNLRPAPKQKGVKELSL